MEAEDILEFDETITKTKLTVVSVDTYLEDFLSKLVFFKSELFRKTISNDI